MSKESFWKYSGVGAALSSRIIAVGLNAYLPGKMLGRIHWNMLQAFAAEIKERSPYFQHVIQMYFRSLSQDKMDCALASNDQTPEIVKAAQNNYINSVFFIVEIYFSQINSCDQSLCLQKDHALVEQWLTNNIALSCMQVCPLMIYSLSYRYSVQTLQAFIKQSMSTFVGFVLFWILHCGLKIVLFTDRTVQVQILSSSILFIVMIFHFVI